MKRLFQLMVFSFAIVALSYLAFTQSQDDTSQRTLSSGCCRRKALSPNKKPQ